MPLRDIRIYIYQTEVGSTAKVKSNGTVKGYS